MDFDYNGEFRAKVVKILGEDAASVDAIMALVQEKVDDLNAEFAGDLRDAFDRQDR